LAANPQSANRNPQSLPRRFHVIACHVLWREFCYFAALSENVFTFDFLKQGLHNEPDKLRASVQAAIDALKPEEPAQDLRYAAVQPSTAPEAILLGYGLCSNGIRGIRARHIPVVVPRAHDCLTFLLGSKERYREYFDLHPGTYWYSPGWIDTHTQPGSERLNRLREKYAEKYGVENADFLMETELAWIKKYTQAAYVDLEFGDSQKYAEHTQACAAQLGWQCDILKGNPKLLNDLLSGNWNKDEFLVVEPGQEIMPSDDENILKATP